MSARLSIATPQRPTSPKRHHVVGVDPQQRRHVERRRQPITAGADDLLEPPVRVVRRPEAGEHPHRPQLRAVHRRVRATGVRVHARELAVLRPVHRLERDCRHRRERRVAQPGRVVRPLPLLTGIHLRQFTWTSKDRRRLSAKSPAPSRTLPQHGVDLRRRRLVEHAEPELHLVQRLCRLGGDRPARLGDRGQHATTIGGVPPPLDQPPLLEPVDGVRDARRMDHQALAHLARAVVRRAARTRAASTPRSWRTSTRTGAAHPRRRPARAAGPASATSPPPCARPRPSARSSDVAPRRSGPAAGPRLRR